MSTVIKHNLTRAQRRMKHQADKYRQEGQFAVGDWVYLKLQPYIQRSVAQRSNQKLSYKFIGPYLITQKVGPVAYKLQLPANSQIHPVIHISQLKKALPPSTAISAVDELFCISSSTLCCPAQVLSYRLHKVGNKLQPFGLIQWKDMPEDWTTWENLHAVSSVSRYSTATLNPNQPETGNWQRSGRRPPICILYTQCHMAVTYNFELSIFFLEHEGELCIFVLKRDIKETMSL